MPPTLFDHLPDALRIGRADVAGPLAVFPLFGHEPRLKYVSYAEGASRGVAISELPGGASVNDVLVHNPLDVGVLLYEGEEILGAQQDRTVDAAVLVGAGVKLQVPVSCVERGRWDGSRHDEAFAASPRTAFPDLRARKNRRMRERLAAGLAARADQGEVWEAVDHKLDAHAAPSSTRAMGDVFADRRDRLGELQSGIDRHDGQVGMIATIGGQFVVLDYVSRPDVFAALFGPLVQGYALDALDRETAAAAAAPTARDAMAFLSDALTAPVRVGATAGIGQSVHFASGRTAGTGLTTEGELVQLSVYDTRTTPAAGSGRIHRPSRRR
jgi:hypothetical protein